MTKSFRHLPVRSLLDATHNFEQLIPTLNLEGGGSEGGVSPDISLGNEQTMAYTVKATDIGKTIEVNNAGEVKITISAGVMALGSIFAVLQIAGGKAKIEGGGGVTVVTPTELEPETRGQYSLVIVRQRAANFWHLSGDLSP